VDCDFIIPSDNTTISPISRITLSIAPADDESISSLGPAAANVLTTNINDQNGDRFVQNLTNLAKWDGCSEHPNQGLNCFAALKGVEDALELIYAQERKTATEKQVILKGWGKPDRNQRHLVGLSITYAKCPEDYSVLVGVEPRRPHYIHAPLQTTYLPSDEPFIEDKGMFPLGPASPFLEEVPNWLGLVDPNIDTLVDAPCSFVMDLEPAVIVSVEAAKKICEIIEYGGWGDVLTGVVKEQWGVEDTSLEELLVCHIDFC
jgi:hypothetical protein